MLSLGMFLALFHLVFFQLALFPNETQAVPLSAKACEKLRAQREALLILGVSQNMKNGPEWAKKNLDQYQIFMIKHFIEVEQQLRFRCFDKKSQAAVGPLEIVKPTKTELAAIMKIPKHAKLVKMPPKPSPTKDKKERTAEVAADTPSPTGNPATSPNTDGTPDDGPEGDKRTGPKLLPGTKKRVATLSPESSEPTQIEAAAEREPGRNASGEGEAEAESLAEQSTPITVRNPPMRKPKPPRYVKRTGKSKKALDAPETTSSTGMTELQRRKIFSFP